MLRIRFSLLNLARQCEKIGGRFFSDLASDRPILNDSNPFEWFELKREFENLLSLYDNGEKLNEDIILNMSNVNITENTIIINRLIKLIKIV